MFVAALAATPFIAERERSARNARSRFIGALCPDLSTCRGRAFHILFFQGFKIQIQAPNLHAISEAYAAKSENMGGIGEKLGGVA